MVTIISDDLLKDLNDGKVINLEVGVLGFSLASEAWARKQEEYLDKINAVGNPILVEDLKEAIKHFDPDRKVKNHATMDIFNRATDCGKGGTNE